MDIQKVNQLLLEAQSYNLKQATILQKLQVKADTLDEQKNFKDLEELDQYKAQLDRLSSQSRAIVQQCNNYLAQFSKYLNAEDLDPDIKAMLEQASQLLTALKDSAADYKLTRVKPLRYREYRQRYYFSHPEARLQAKVRLQKSRSRRKAEDYQGYLARNRIRTRNWQKANPERFKASVQKYQRQPAVKQSMLTRSMIWNADHKEKLRFNIAHSKFKVFVTPSNKTKVLLNDPRVRMQYYDDLATLWNCFREQLDYLTEQQKNGEPFGLKAFAPLDNLAKQPSLLELNLDDSAELQIARNYNTNRKAAFRWGCPTEKQLSSAYQRQINAFPEQYMENLTNDIELLASRLDRLTSQHDFSFEKIRKQREKAEQQVQLELTEETRKPLPVFSQQKYYQQFKELHSGFNRFVKTTATTAPLLNDSRLSRVYYQDLLELQRRLVQHLESMQSDNGDIEFNNYSPAIDADLNENELKKYRHLRNCAFRWAAPTERQKHSLTQNSLYNNADKYFNTLTGEDQLALKKRIAEVSKQLVQQ